MSDSPSDPGHSISVREMDGDGLVEALEEGLDPLLKGTGIQPEQKKAIVHVARTVVEQYHGPLPHPEHLERYERVLSGAADRIIRMAEKEQSHRQKLESGVITWNAAEDILGRVSGLLVSIGFIVGAVVCAYLDQPLVGVAMVGAGAAGIITALVRGREETEETQAPVQSKKTPPKKKRK